MNRVTILLFVALLWLVALSRAQAGITSPSAITITATSSLGTASWSFPAPAQFTSGSWSLTLAPGGLILVDPTNGNTIAIISNLSLTFSESNPSTSMSFTVVSGESDTTVSISSGVLDYPSRLATQSQTSVGLSLTDRDGDGSRVSGTGPGSTIYRARYGSGSAYADLIPTFAVGSFGTEARVANKVTPISGVIDSLQVVYEFAITRRDSVSGTSSFGVSCACVPLESASPNTVVVVPSNRPDPGSNSTTTYNIAGMVVNAGSTFVLGSGETLNLGGGNGTLVVEPGAVFVANGLVQGNIINRGGLIIIPITRVGLVSRVISGPVMIPSPVPLSPPGLPPPLPVIVTPPTPPAIGGGAIVAIGGPPFTGGGGPGGGGWGGGGTGGGGTYVINTPSFGSAGAILLDGELEVTGTFEQTDNGFLRLYIAGRERGRSYCTLEVGDHCSLSGTLQVVLRPELFEFVPDVGESFDLVTAGGGISIGTNGLRVMPLMTRAGAVSLGITAPDYLSPFERDPDALVVLPEDLFSWQVVDSQTLRVTMAAPICGSLVGPASAIACPRTSASFSVKALGSGPVAFQWERFDVPSSQWTSISDGSNANLGTVAGATTSTLSVSRLQQLASEQFRCRIATGCGERISGTATLQVLANDDLQCCPCSSDYNSSGSSIPDIDDLIKFFEDFNEGDSVTTDGDPSADVDCTGPASVPDIDDIIKFFEVFADGC